MMTTDACEWPALRVRLERWCLRSSFEEVASATGYNRSTVYRWVEGHFQRPPLRTRLVVLAAVEDWEDAALSPTQRA
jgi:predicted DNA-binding transcriptional regulator AlpA